MELDPVYLYLVELYIVFGPCDPVDIDPLELVPVELDPVYLYFVELDPVKFLGPVNIKLQ